MNSSYRYLSKIPVISGSYTLKLLFVCLIGILIPLVTILLIAPISVILLCTTPVIVAIICITLCTTALTMYFIKDLLRPISIAYNSLDDYQLTRKVPTLPTGYKDEIGVFMDKLQHFITEMDMHISNKNDLVALLSHDMRTPFTQLSTYAMLIETESEDEEIKDTCRKMIALAENQLNSLDNVLKLLVLNDNVVASDLKPVLLDTVIDTATLSLSSQTLAKNITIEKGYRRDLEIKGSLFSLSHLFQNLLSNAIKFSYPGSKVRVVAKELNNDLVVNVIDEGAGFEQSEADHLFDRFTKGKTGTAGERSTGIGLYLARKITSLYKGSIFASSEGKGKGAMFTVTFPLSIVATTSSAIQTLSQ